MNFAGPDKFHGRLLFIARHKTPAEVAREIVEGGLRLSLDDAAHRLREAEIVLISLSLFSWCWTPYEF